MLEKIFLKLLEEKESKYLTDFKKIFQLSKKNHDDYRNSKIVDKVSIDQPIIDYVKIISDWLDFDSNGLFTLHYSQVINIMNVISKMIKYIFHLK